MQSSWPSFGVVLSSDDMGVDRDPFYAREIPVGAILRGFKDEDAEIAGRLRNKRCPEEETSYYGKLNHFSEIQESRAYKKPNEFYELLRRKALLAEDADRQTRIEKAQHMFMMHAMGELKGNFIGWKVSLPSSTNESWSA